jgi:hypothetical protein
MLPLSAGAVHFKLETAVSKTGTGHDNYQKLWLSGSFATPKPS